MGCGASTVITPRVINPLLLTKHDRISYNEVETPHSPVFQNIELPPPNPVTVSEKKGKAQGLKKGHIGGHGAKGESKHTILRSGAEQFDIFEEPVPYEELRQQIEAKFNNRSTKEALIARNILKGNISGNLLQAQLSLKFNMASDRLGQTLARQPHREYLVEKNILKDIVGDRSLQGVQVAIIRQKVQDRLRIKLERRPTLTQLQEQG